MGGLNCKTMVGHNYEDKILLNTAMAAMENKPNSILFERDATVKMLVDL